MKKRDNPSSLNYFISYTDLLVGLLFLFIILLMTFALSFRNAQVVLENRLDDIERRVDIRRVLLNRIRDNLRLASRGRLEVQVDADQGILRFGEGVLFDAGSAHLDSAAEDALNLLARELARELPCYGSERGANCPQGSEPILEAVYIEGHTDSQDIHTRQYPTNWHLASDRAYQTYNHLIGRAPRLRSVLNSSGTFLLSASAYADQRPVTSRDEAHWPENRRIDIRFLLAPPTRDQVRAARNPG